MSSVPPRPATTSKAAPNSPGPVTSAQSTKCRPPAGSALLTDTAAATAYMPAATSTSAYVAWVDVRGPAVPSAAIAHGTLERRGVGHATGAGALFLRRARRIIVRWTLVTVACAP